MSREAVLVSLFVFLEKFVQYVTGYFLYITLVIILKPEAEREKEKQAAQEELKKALQEKEQALMDLNSMERSFADLFKRLEKHKEVIEGYKKVGSSLFWLSVPVCVDPLLEHGIVPRFNRI